MHYKECPDNAAGEIIVTYSENYTKKYIMWVNWNAFWC